MARLFIMTFGLHIHGFDGFFFESTDEWEKVDQGKFIEVSKSHSEYMRRSIPDRTKITLT